MCYMLMFDIFQQTNKTNDSEPDHFARNDIVSNTDSQAICFCEFVSSSSASFSQTLWCMKH